MARGMGRQRRTALHPRRHSRGPDRSRRRFRAGETDRARRADHRHAHRLSPGSDARRSHSARQSHPRSARSSRPPKRKFSISTASFSPAAAALILPRRQKHHKSSRGNDHEDLDRPVFDRGFGCGGARRRKSRLGLSGDAAAGTARQRHDEIGAGQLAAIYAGADRRSVQSARLVSQRAPGDAADCCARRTKARRPGLRAVPSALGRRASGIRQPCRAAGELHQPPDGDVQARRAQQSARRRHDRDGAGAVRRRHQSRRRVLRQASSPRPATTP